MDFDSWNSQNSQSDDPYTFKIDDDDSVCLARKRKKRKSKTKSKHFFKSCTSHISIYAHKSQKEYFCSSPWCSSQAVSSHTSERTFYKQNNVRQVPQKPYKFFKSRSCLLLSGKNLIPSAGSNSKYASQEYSNVKCSLETHHLADTGNDGMVKTLITQDNVELADISSINMLEKQSKTNSPNSKKQIMSPKEEYIFLTVPRTLPLSAKSEESTPALCEGHTLNMRNISQNVQMPSQMTEPFMFPLNRKKAFYKRLEKKTLAKPNKFFKNRNRDEIFNHIFDCFTRNRYAYQDRKSFNVEKYLPRNYGHINNKTLGKDPYSFESEDRYSNTKNAESKYVTTKIKHLFHDRKRFNVEKHKSGTDCHVSSKPQSKYPHSFEMVDDDDHKITLNKKCLSEGKQKDIIKSSNNHFPKVELFSNKQRGMQSTDATDQKILHSMGKQNLMSAKAKAADQHFTNKIINKSKEESDLTGHATINEKFQHTNESNEVLSLPNLIENISWNLHGKETLQTEINGASSSLINKGKTHTAVISSKKCSIACTCVIKNTLSAITYKRSSLWNTNLENIYREDNKVHGTLWTSGNIHCKKQTVNNRETCKLAHGSNTKFFPLVTDLAELYTQSKPSAKKQAEITHVINNNEDNKLVSTTYFASTRKTVAKPLFETKASCLPETNSIDMNVDVLKPLKDTRSSYMSTAKSVDTEMEFCHSEIRQNHLINELHSKYAADEREDSFKKIPEDFQPSLSSEQTDFHKILTNISADGLEITKRYQITSTISREKHRMKNQVKGKVNINKANLIRQKVKVNSKDIKTTEKTSLSENKYSTKQILNNSSKTRLLQGSSFKKQIFISNKRKNNSLLYKHTWAEDEECERDIKQISDTGLLVQPIELLRSDNDLEELKTPELLCVTSKHAQSIDSENEAEAVMDLKCNNIEKKYFTTIKNVRNSDQMQELGEFQELNDDIEYILDALQDHNPKVTRCHSALTLASKCLMPAFRTHIRTFGTMTKLFCTLYDAADDQSLALCTATIMFVLSVYELYAYMCSSGMQLLLSLLNSSLTCEIECVQLQNIRKRVMELCTEVQRHGFAKHLHLENIIANHLASEILLSLSSSDSGYLVENHLREKGGLEHIIKAINNCRTEVNAFFIQWKGDLLDKLRFLDCCLQVLECFTRQSEDNQQYLLKYQSGSFMGTMAALFSRCTREFRNVYLIESAPSEIAFEVLCTILKVLINLTQSVNNSSLGSSLIAKRPYIIHTSLYILLEAPWYVPKEKRFDLLALVLTFLINSIEHNICNRKLIFEAKASDLMIPKYHSSNTNLTMEALIEFFYEQEKLARIEELKTEAMLDDQIDSKISHEPLEPSQEFITKLQEKAGQNMECTMIASYLVLLIGYLIADNEEYEIYVRQHLPQKSFLAMISVLEKMHSFFNLVPTISCKHDIAQIQNIIQYLKQSDEKALAATSKEYQS